MKKAVPEIKPEIAADVDSDELPLIDGDEPAEAEGDETLIEEVEEDNPDVAGIIDTPIEPDEKPEVPHFPRMRCACSDL